MGFWVLIVIDRDIVTEHQAVSKQSNLHLINRFYSSKFHVDVIHSVKMVNVSVTLKVKHMRETAHFNVS